MYAPAQRHQLAVALANAFLAGEEWSERGLIARGAVALEPPPAWLRAVVATALARHATPPHGAPRALAATIAERIEVIVGTGPPPRVVRLAAPAPGAPHPRFGVPELTSPDALGELLGLCEGSLAWLADVRSLERGTQEERLRNYRYGWVPRASGAPPRVIERPKARLKAAQRTVLRELLAHVPPHDAAHGFVPGRSAAGHAALHAGRRVVLRFDVEDFFAGIAPGRVFAVFRTAGYPEAVAHLLTGLCTNVVPARAWAAVPRPATLTAIGAHHRLGRRLATPHLPQGAPTSPALANLVAFRLDRRLAGLAASVGATYSRYADDLVLSGDRELQRRLEPTRAAVAQIVAAEGFVLHPGKSQLMHHAGRQRVCGMVVNVAPNLAREEHDRLRALLHDAARNGPARANRAGLPNFRAHLTGRVAWATSLNPGRGARLQAQLAQIDWG